MSPCILCSVPNRIEFDFCTNCGWPCKQPSPYGGIAKTLPVAPFETSPQRDTQARPLAFIPDSSGRAFVPGQNSLARDKVPDYPTGAGAGGRRCAEVLPGTGWERGSHARTQSPIGAVFGAGRVVWVDTSELFVWNPAEEQVDRKPLGSFTMLPGDGALAAVGWFTYLRTAQGLVSFDGLTGSIEVESQTPFEYLAPYCVGVAGSIQDKVTLFTRTAAPTVTTAPFAICSLLSDQDRLVAMGETGEAALLEAGQWRMIAEPLDSHRFLQAWLVNGCLGLMTTSPGRSLVRYFDLALREPLTTTFEVVSDAPLCVVPGRTGFEAHRVLGFVGGSDPHVNVYQPTQSTPERRSFGTSGLDVTVAMVRRAAEGNAIVVASVDAVDSKLNFFFLRDSSKPLPRPLPLPANTLKKWLLPHAQGLALLVWDGSRSILNNIPFPV